MEFNCVKVIEPLKGDSSLFTSPLDWPHKDERLRPTGATTWTDVFYGNQLLVPVKFLGKNLIYLLLN